MPEVSTRLAERADLDTVAALSHEMERHYDGPDAAPLATIRPRVEAALFGPRPLAEALLAELAGRAEGVAVFQPLFPARSHTTGLLLKDLFVLPRARGKGIGRALMRALAGLALERGYTRMDWTTERDNLRARSFYRDLGAVEEEKSYYRLREAGLAALAGTAES